MQAQADNTGAPAGMKLPPVVDRIANQTPGNKAPICVLMVGMAGSGKTTLLAQLQQSTMPNETDTEGEEEEQEEAAVDPSQNDNEDKDKDKDEDEDKKPSASTAASPPTGQRAKMPAYCVNLDPATLNVPYNASIDIRDTVDYKVRSNIGCHQRTKGEKLVHAAPLIPLVFPPCILFAVFFDITIFDSFAIYIYITLTASYATTQFGSQWSDHDIFEFICH